MRIWSNKRIEEALSVLQKRFEKGEIKQSEITQENALRLLNDLTTLAEIAIDSYHQNRSSNSKI